VGQADRLGQAVSHQGPGGDHRANEAPIDHVADNKALFGHGHGARQRQHGQTFFVPGHFQSDVQRLAELAPGKSGVVHGAKKVRERANGAQVQTLERLESVGPPIV
jgi:hypothetical protein